MKSYYVVFVCSMMVSALAVAEKPEWAGKGKPTAEQKEAHKSSMKSKENGMERDNAREEKIKDKASSKEKTLKSDKSRIDKPKKPVEDKSVNSEKEGKQRAGFEKQADKKNAQTQNELGKGAERGQEASSAKRKWWKFWE